MSTQATAAGILAGSLHDWDATVLPVEQVAAVVAAELHDAGLLAPEWVPVSERLPEQRGQVAVTVYDQLPQVTSVYFDPGFYWEEEGESGTVPPSWGGGFYNGKVTHWQPLPAPPHAG